MPLSQKIAFEKVSSSLSIRDKNSAGIEKKSIDAVKGEKAHTLTPTQRERERGRVAGKEINAAVHCLLSYFSFESNWLLLKKRERYSIIFLLHERI